MARSSSNTMLWLLLAVFASLAAAGAGRGDDGRRSSPQVYVVYMGAVPPRTSPDLLLESHLRLLGTVLKRSSSSQSFISIYARVPRCHLLICFAIRPLWWTGLPSNTFWCP